MNHSHQRNLQPNQYELHYQPQEVQGQCIMLAIIPVKLNKLKYSLYLFLSIITLGIIPILAYWYPQLKNKIAFQSVKLQESTHFCIQNYDNEIDFVQKKEGIFFNGKQQLKKIYFINRYLKYYVHSNIVTVSQYQFIKERIIQLIKNSKGWTLPQSQKLIQSFGQGAIIINQPTACQIFIRQIFRPLYLFIIINVLVQYFMGYYIYLVIITSTAIVGIIMTIFQVLKVSNQIYKMAFCQVELNVMRQGLISKISSTKIVVGDLVFFDKPCRIPFQGVLLQGQLLVNQCALTGQSVPVAKKSDSLERYQEGKNPIKTSQIFEGTTIIQINRKKPIKIWQKYRLEYGIPVCVTRTNFLTLKGQLVRKILYPINLENKFQRQSMKFLYFLFFLTLISYLIVVSQIYQNVSIILLIKSGLNLVTTDVPPTLPISMLIGVMYAVQKLKKKNIFTISPNKIIEGGQLQIMCFDKTGTLTNDHMDFKALLPSDNGIFLSRIQIQNFEQLNIPIKIKNRFLSNMASNHTVVKIQQTGQLIGDPMQTQLVKAAKCELSYQNEDSSIIFQFKGPQINGKVLQRYDFQSQLQRMSVIVQLQNKQIYIFTKGSPEIMSSLMIAESIPKNYIQQLRNLTSSGFRVLAIASKHITKQQWKNLDRYQIQKNLQFDGFEIFQNGLKQQTQQAIIDLRQNNINPIMITGDNSITACNIGYQSYLLNSNIKTIIIDYNNNNFKQEIFQFYYNKQNIINYYQSIQNISYQQIDHNNQILQYIYKLINKLQSKNYHLCLTGNAFCKLITQKNQDQKLHPLEAHLLRKTQIFARTKPKDKAFVVKLYQSLGKIVGMCGDGANDCDALHQANLGLSLSDTEASIAAAFTSKQRHIGSMVQLIKESRAGLATNFSLFNIMASYALTQFTTTLMLYCLYAFPLDIFFAYWDFILNLMFVFLLGNIKTGDKLTKQRPPQSLFSISNITQLLSFVILQLLGQILTILAISGPFADNIDYYSHGGIINNLQKFKQQGGKQFVRDTPQNSAIFLVVGFYYLSSIISFTITHPWKKSIFSYLPFFIIFLITFIYSILIAIIPSTRLSIFNINGFQDQQLNRFLLLIGLGIGIISTLIIKIILQPFFKSIQSSIK